MARPHPQATDRHRPSGHRPAGLLTVAARDLHRRPPEQVRGTKRLWVPVIAMNYMGAGPLIYLLGGRRWRRTAGPSS